MRCVGDFTIAIAMGSKTESLMQTLPPILVPNLIARQSISERDRCPSRSPVSARPDQYVRRDAKRSAGVGLSPSRARAFDSGTSAIRVRVAVIASRSLRVDPCCSMRNVMASIGSGGSIGRPTSGARRASVAGPCGSGWVGSWARWRGTGSGRGGWRARPRYWGTFSLVGNL